MTVGAYSYRTIGDMVLEHAKAGDAGGTDTGIRYLELDGAITAGCINGAGNLYLAALAIIRELQKRSHGPNDRQYGQILNRFQRRALELLDNWNVPAAHTLIEELASRRDATTDGDKHG